MHFSFKRTVGICFLVSIFAAAGAQTTNKDRLASTFSGSTEVQPTTFHTSSDSIYRDGIIEIKKSGGKSLFMHGDSLLTEKELSGIFKGHARCESDYRASQTLRKTTNGFILASVVSTGIAGITFIIHDKKGGGRDKKSKYDPSFLYAGLACLGISIPLTLTQHIYLDKAITTYNQEQNRRSSALQLQLKATTQSIALTVAF